jgi:hypothetical protein
MATRNKKTLATPASRSATKTIDIPAKKVNSPKTEKFASKPSTTAENATQKSDKKKTTTPEDRYPMIATTAYFRAEQRGFADGYEMADWIPGEAQIVAKLNA